MKKYRMQHGKETWKQLEEIHRFGYSYATIFNDFVETCLLAILSLTDNMKHADLIERLQQNRLTGIYEEQYLQLVAKYKENKSHERGKRPIDHIAKAWGLLQKETKEVDQDVLGEIFMTQISGGEHGQFFTPFPVTDIMTQILVQRCGSIAGVVAACTQLFAALYAPALFTPPCTRSRRRRNSQ